MVDNYTLQKMLKDLMASLDITLDQAVDKLISSVYTASDMLEEEA